MNIHEVVRRNSYLAKEFSKPSEAAPYSRLVNLNFSYDTNTGTRHITQTEPDRPFYANTPDARESLQQEIAHPAKLRYDGWSILLAQGFPVGPLELPSRQINSATYLGDEKGNKVYLIFKVYSDPKTGLIRLIPDLPAGCPDPKETPEEAGNRETFCEETVMRDPRTGQLILPETSTQETDHMVKTLVANYQEACDAQLVLPSEMNDLICEVAARAGTSSMYDLIKPIPQNSCASWMRAIPDAVVTTVSPTGEVSKKTGKFIMHREGPEFGQCYQVADPEIYDLEISKHVQDGVRGAFKRPIGRVTPEAGWDIMEGRSTEVEFFVPGRGYVAQSFAPDPRTHMKALAQETFSVIKQSPQLAAA